MGFSSVKTLEKRVQASLADGVPALLILKLERRDRADAVGPLVIISLNTGITIESYANVSHQRVAEDCLRKAPIIDTPQGRRIHFIRVASRARTCIRRKFTSLGGTGSMRWDRSGLSP